MKCRFCKNLQECMFVADALKLWFDPDTVSDLCDRFEFYLDLNSDMAEIIYIRKYIDKQLGVIAGEAAFYDDLEIVKTFIKNNPWFGNRAFLFQGVKEISLEDQEKCLEQ